jgi:hypothetical protein
MDALPEEKMIAICVESKTNYNGNETSVMHACTMVTSLYLWGGRNTFK